MPIHPTTSDDMEFSAQELKHKIGNHFSEADFVFAFY